MDAFITPKGTKLPLLNLRGKFYLQVAYRIVWFREDYPFGKIETECIERTDKFAIFRATISIPWNNDYWMLASATKREDSQHFGDYLEKAETSSIGRALALCGYGTQFAQEIEEHDRIVDSPVDVPVKEEDRDFGRPAALTVDLKLDQNTTLQTGKYKGKTFPEVWAVDKTYHKFLERLHQHWPDQKNYMDYVKGLTDG